MSGRNLDDISTHILMERARAEGNSTNLIPLCNLSSNWMGGHRSKSPRKGSGSAIQRSSMSMASMD